MFFGVAVQAEKDAFVCFLLEPFETGGDLPTDGEFF